MSRVAYFGMGVCASVGVLVAVLAVQHMHTAAAMALPQALPVPDSYREWRFLSSGLDMTYTAAEAGALPPNHDGQFDNVFVNPEAYAQFHKDGTWPDQTVFVLENRVGLQHASINQAGRSQGPLTGIEMHVKRAGQWGFYVGQADGREHLVPRSADCYSCHAAHAAVDNTFVQFYPTLLPIAASKHTLSAAYEAETGVFHPKS